MSTPSRTWLPLAAVGFTLLAWAYVRYGMDPGDAIVSATSGAARILGLDDSLGTVEAGKIADLIVVDGDPLADISVLEHGIRLVVKDGTVEFQGRKVHVREAQPA